MAFVRFEGRGERNGGGVGTAASERGNIAFAADALEAGDDDDFALGEVGAHFFVIDAFDAGFGVGSIGFEGDLPAGVAFGIHADVFQCHCQKADGHLLAGGQDYVQFARIGMLLHFVRQRNQAVGFAAHGGYDDNDVVSFGAGFGDTFGYVFNAFGRAY